MYLFLEKDTNIIDYIVESYIVITDTNVKLMINGLCIRLYKPLSNYNIIEVTSVPDEVCSHKFKYENEEYIYIPNYISIISKKELLDRMTEDELKKMIEYEQHINTLEVDELEKSNLKTKMKILWEKWRSLDFINLDSLAEISEFSNTLVNAQIVSNERMIEITTKQSV